MSSNSRRALFAIVIGLLALTVLSACEPTERVVAKVERKSSSAGNGPMPDNAGAGDGAGAEPAADADENLDASLEPAPDPTGDGCEGIGDAYMYLSGVVHFNDCKARPWGQMSLEQTIDFIEYLREVTDVVRTAAEGDASVSPEETTPDRCAYEPDLLGYLETPPAPGVDWVWVLCPSTCRAVEQWLQDKNAQCDGQL